MKLLLLYPFLIIFFGLLTFTKNDYKIIGAIIGIVFLFVVLGFLLVYLIQLWWSVL